MATNDGTPDFRCGLHMIVPEGCEEELPYGGEEGATWHLDKNGCLRLTDYGDFSCTVSVSKREGQMLRDDKIETSKEAAPADKAHDRTEKLEEKEEEKEKETTESEASKIKSLIRSRSENDQSAYRNPSNKKARYR